MANIYKALFFITCVSLFVPVSTYADTVAPSEISTTTAWTIENSPYIVSSALTIDASGTLSIEPGVVVKAGSQITVLGTLSANGSPNQQIILTSSDDSAKSPWELAVLPGGHLLLGNTIFRHSSGGIYLDSTSTAITDSQISDSAGILANGGQLTLRNDDFENVTSVLGSFNQNVATISSTTANHVSGGDAFAVYNSGSAALTDVSIGDVKTSAVSVYNQGTLSCSHCSIQESTSSPGSDSVRAYTGSSLILDHSTVLSSGSDAALALYDTSGTSSSTALVSDSILDGGRGNGIVTFGSAFLTVASATIKDFSGDGILAYNGAHLSVSSSDIESNTNGFEMYKNVSGSISSSTIQNNSAFGATNPSTVPFDARNNWWGDTTGPANPAANPNGKGNQVSDNIEFSPWVTELTVPKPPCCSSVAFIPGIEASRLYESNTAVPGNPSVPGNLIETRYWEPGLTTNTNVLDLNPDGTSIKKDIYTRDTIDGGSFLGLKKYDVYSVFQNYLTSLVSSGAIAAWQALPYDWRFGADAIALNPIALKGGQSYSMLLQIEQMAKFSKTGKVTIVAHSYGGLVAKELISLAASKGESNLIDKLILAASPQLGTPESAPAMLHGDDQAIGGGIILQAQTARNLAENMPMAYGLLPSPSYFSLVADPIITFDSSIDSVNNFRKIYGNAINSASQLDSFLIGKDGRRQPPSSDLKDPAVLSSNLIASGTSVHTALDSWVAPSGISVYQIAGVGIPTLKGIVYKATQSCVLGNFLCGTPTLDHAPRETDQGDNTVIIESATAYKGAETFYVNLAGYNTAMNSAAGHQTFLEIPPTQNLIGTILRGDEQAYASPYVSTSSPSPQSIITIGVHSPVSLAAQDALGRSTGLSAGQAVSSSIEFADENIPNSHYLQFGEGKYIVLPASGSYQVSLSGQSAGSFTLTLDQSINGITVASTTYSDVPVSSSTKATLSIMNGSSTLLYLDNNGDGTLDATITPDASLNASSTDALWSRLRQFIGSYCSRAEKNSLLSTLEQWHSKIKNLKKDSMLSSVQSVLDGEYKGETFTAASARNYVSDLFDAFTKAFK